MAAGSSRLLNCFIILLILRYHDQWRFGAQKLVFIVSFTEFLSSGNLLNWRGAADKLHLSTDRTSGELYLDLEDYLHGLLHLSNELVS